MLYTHRMMYLSTARTVPTPLIVTLCSVLLWTMYMAPGKVVARTLPLSTVPLCIYPVWVRENITVSTDEGELV